MSGTIDMIFEEQRVFTKLCYFEEWYLSGCNENINEVPLVEVSFCKRS